jgi:hypothetical protein
MRPDRRHNGSDGSRYRAIVNDGRKRPRSELRGRAETGLERELLDRRDIGKAERAALRTQARAVDVAERAREPDAVTRANAVYLDLRKAAGLTSGGAQPVDVFEQLLAEISRPSAGSSDVPNT